MDTAITHEAHEDAAASPLGFYTGDNGRALYTPAGSLVCYHDDARAICAQLNATRLEQLRRERAADDEPRASRAFRDEPRASWT